MLRTWLSLALIPALAGCFLHHGEGGDGSADAGSIDAGPDLDAALDGGACTENVGQISALRCPPSAPAGATVSIAYTHTNPTCCSTGTSRVSVARSGSTWSLRGEWSVCDCCDACRCIGPSQDETIEIGPLDPGVHRVVADFGECTIVVEDEPRECRPMAPSGLRAQRVLFEGQRLGFSLVQDGTSCGCQPRLTRALDDVFVAELCDCCDECFCIDPPYAVSYLGPEVAFPPTMVNDIALPTEHRTLESCRPIEPTGLRIEAPESPVNRDGPAIWWAVVSGVQTVCCVEPFGGVQELMVGAAGRHLELRSCVEFDCDCLGAPHSFEAWHPLGELASGRHSIRAGAHEVSFVVD